MKELITIMFLLASLGAAAYAQSSFDIAGFFRSFFGRSECIICGVTPMPIRTETVMARQYDSEPILRTLVGHYTCPSDQARIENCELHSKDFQSGSGFEVVGDDGTPRGVGTGTVSVNRGRTAGIYQEGCVIISGCTLVSDVVTTLYVGNGYCDNYPQYNYVEDSCNAPQDCLNVQCNDNNGDRGLTDMQLALAGIAIGIGAFMYLKRKR